MNTLDKKIINEYKQIQVMFQESTNELLEIPEKDCGRLGQTLGVLVNNGYLSNMNADDSFFYIRNPSFDCFEEQFRAEIGEPLPKLFSLFKEIDSLRKEFQYAEIDIFGPDVYIINDNIRFKTWKKKVEYELQKLNQVEIIKQCLRDFDSFNGFNDEDMFDEIVACLDVIVDQYDDFILSPQLEQPQQTEKAMKDKKIFISHAELDEPYMKVLVELFEFMGFNSTNLFCSSVAGYGVPNSEGIYPFLRDSFNNYDLHVIFAHSHNFYTRTVCLNEMGAAWVARSKFTSILLPGFDFKNMNGVVNDDTAAIKLDSDPTMVRYRLNELYKTLIEDFHLTPMVDIVWEQKRDAFIEKINAVVLSPVDDSEC